VSGAMVFVKNNYGKTRIYFNVYQLAKVIKIFNFFGKISFVVIQKLITVEI